MTNTLDDLLGMPDLDLGPVVVLRCLHASPEWSCKLVWCQPTRSCADG